MKAHSLQYKFLTTVISAILVVTICIGGLSIYEVDQFVELQAETFIHVTCEKEAAQVNAIFSDMEKSVKIMENYVLDSFGSMAEIENREKQKEIIEDADHMFCDVAKHTRGAVAYYIRFAPEISDYLTGFFYSKGSGIEEYIRLEETDLSLYDRNDTEHVGWYWQPYEAGKPVWMKPYHNRNNDITMISYVVPLYCEGRFVGVVGMDFDYTVLTDKVHDIKIYEHGFAHLELDGEPICYGGPVLHSRLQEEYLQVSEALVNGMTLVLSASYEDIGRIGNEISLRILCVALVLAAVFSLIAMMRVRKIVKPLEMLTEASKNLADGNYDVVSVPSDIYEIQLLTAAFGNMTQYLQEHEKLQYLLAYRDSLTGLRNVTSYKAWIKDFDREIKSSEKEFGVLMFDVNCLKETNDQYGHEIGNKLIVACARLIAGTFKRSPVFRIGGDEFLVILQNSDLTDWERLWAKLDLECAGISIEVDHGKIPVSIARGFAKYDPDTDCQFVDVFNRADDDMYKNKRAMKLSQESKYLFKA